MGFFSGKCGVLSVLEFIHPPQTGRVNSDYHKSNRGWGKRINTWENRSLKICHTVKPDR